MCGRAIGDYEEAEENFRRGLALSKNTNVDCHYELGRILLELSESKAELLDEAIEHFTYLKDIRWQELFDDNTFLLAMCWEKKDMQKAREIVRWLMSENREQSFLEACKEAARYSNMLKDFSQAEIHARTALESNPEYIPVTFELAHSLYYQKKYSTEAIECLTKFIANNPQNTRALRLMLGFALARSSWELALSSSEKILDVEPNFPSVMFTRSELLLRLGRVEEAVHSMRQTLRLWHPRMQRDRNYFLKRKESFDQLTRFATFLETPREVSNWHLLEKAWKDFKIDFGYDVAEWKII